jgi:hypothetical protein
MSNVKNVNSSKNGARPPSAADGKSNSNGKGVIGNLFNSAQKFITPAPQPPAASKNANGPPKQMKPKMTHSEREKDPVFRCRLDIRNKELHDVCAKNNNCDLVKTCNMDPVKWKLGQPDKWKEVKASFARADNPEKTDKAFFDTNDCIRGFLKEKFQKEFDECDKLRPPSNANKNSANAAKNATNTTKNAAKNATNTTKNAAKNATDTTKTAAKAPNAAKNAAKNSNAKVLPKTKAAGNAAK